MRKRLRRALIVTSLLVTVLVVAALVIPPFIDVNRYHDEIETRIAGLLGRDVHLGQMQLRLLPRVVIDVTDLGIAALPGEGEGDLLTAARLRLGVRLLPLLSKSVQITSVRLEKPVLVLDRDASGAFNIQHLVAAGPAPEAPDQPGTAPDKGTAFLVDSLHISGGTLTLRDAALSPGRTLTMGLQEMDVVLVDLALDRPVEVNLSTRLVGQPDARITIRGRAGPLQPGAGQQFTTDLRVEISDLSLAPLGEWSEALTGFALPAGTLGLTGAARYGGPGDGELALESLDVHLDSSHLDLAGTVRLAGDNVETNLEVRQMKIDPGEVRTVMGSLGVAWPLPPDLMGDAPVQGTGTARLELALDAAGPRLTLLSAGNVEISGGEVNLRRHADDTWNFASLLETGDDEGTTGTPPRIELSGLHLKDTHLRIRDDRMPDAPPLTITNLDVTLEALPTSVPARFTLKAAVDTGAGKPAPVVVKGTAGPLGENGEIPVNLALQVSGFPVASLGPYAAPYLAVEATSGMLAVDATVKGNLPETLDSAGTIKLDQLVVTVQGPIRGRQPVHLDLGIAFNLSAAHQGAEVTFRDLTVTAGGDSLGLSGHLDSSGATTLIDATLRPSIIGADRIAALLATFDYDPGFSFSSNQPLRLEAHLKGPLSGATAPTVSGSLVLDEFTFRHPVMTAPMEKVSATIHVDGEHVSIEDFSGVMGSSDLSGSVTLAGFAAPDIKFDLHSRRADFWELMSFVSTEAAVPAGQDAAEAGAASLLDTVTARGTLTMDEGSFQTLAFSRLTAQLGLRGQVITLDPLQMDLYAGHFTGSLGLDQTVSPPTFRIVATAKEVDMEPLLAQALEVSDMLSGRFSGQVSVHGAGTDYNTIVSGMNGEGTVELKDGRVGKLDMLGVLSKASGIFGEETLGQLSRKFETEGTGFSRMTGSLDLSGGTMRSNDLRLDSPDLNILGKTAINLMDDTLEGTFKVLLSAELSQSMRQEKSRAAEVFWDSREGRVDVPLALSGPFAAPVPTIDWQTATQNLARSKGREAVKSRLGKYGALLGGDEESSPAPAAAPTGQEAAPRPSPAAPPSDAPPPMSVEITRTHWSGNFLFKSLVVEGKADGLDLDHLSAQVTDASGQSIQNFDRIAFVSPAPGPPAGAPVTSRTWEFKVDGKKLVAGKSPFTVRVVAHSRTGTTVEITTEVRQ